jgi:hypothetical protein
MIGFVIGNGESRKGYDLEWLRNIGVIYGCNALYRDFVPDVLFSVDDRMTKEIKEQLDAGNLSVKEFVYRRRGVDNERGRILQSTLTGCYEDLGYAAGPTALKLMCDRYADLKEVYLVGFDIYSTTGVRNNVYKGTDCYAAVDARPVNPSNWIEKLARIFIYNERVTFYRVTNLLFMPPEWDDVKNVRNISYEDMTVRLTGRLLKHVVGAGGLEECHSNSLQ